MTAEWLDDALCRDYPPEWWFPHDKNQHADWETPRAICRTCPVAALCLKSANEKREDYGMFGGRTPAERQEIRPRTARLHGRGAFNDYAAKTGAA